MVRTRSELQGAKRVQRGFAVNPPLHPHPAGCCAFRKGEEGEPLPDAFLEFLLPGISRLSGPVLRKTGRSTQTPFL